MSKIIKKPAKHVQVKRAFALQALSFRKRVLFKALLAKARDPRVDHQADIKIRLLDSEITALNQFLTGAI
jgi:hypothetical protein